MCVWKEGGRARKRVSFFSLRVGFETFKHFFFLTVRAQLRVSGQRLAVEQLDGDQWGVVEEGLRSSSGGGAWRWWMLERKGEVRKRCPSRRRLFVSMMPSSTELRVLNRDDSSWDTALNRRLADACLSFVTLTRTKLQNSSLTETFAGAEDEGLAASVVVIVAGCCSAFAFAVSPAAADAADATIRAASSMSRLRACDELETCRIFCQHGKKERERKRKKKET